MQKDSVGRRLQIAEVPFGQKTFYLPDWKIGEGGVSFQFHSTFVQQNSFLNKPNFCLHKVLLRVWGAGAFKMFNNWRSMNISPKLWYNSYNNIVVYCESHLRTFCRQIHHQNDRIEGSSLAMPGFQNSLLPKPLNCE